MPASRGAEAASPLRSLHVADLEADVEQRLALLDFYRLQRALERGHHFSCLGDALAVAAGGLHDVLEARRGLERGEGRLAHLGGMALRIDAEGGAVHRRPARV